MDEVDSTIKVAVEDSDDPDSELELQETISAELSASVNEVKNGGVTRSLDEVAQRLGLSS